MNITRRKLLALFGVGGTAAAIAAPMAAAEKAVASNASAATAFRFQCFCGASVVAQVPAKEKAVISVPCPDCGHGYRLTWHGTYFSFADSWVRADEDGNPKPAGPVLGNKETYEDIAGAFKPGTDWPQWSEWVGHQHPRR